MKTVLLFLVISTAALAQEAESGFELRGSFAEQAMFASQLTQDPRAGAPVAGAFRTLLYPVWKIDEHWTVSGAVQIQSRPYFTESFYSQGYGVNSNVIRATLGYSRFWSHRSLVVQIGQMPTAFGSFPLHYDSMDNANTDKPLQYGYYYKPVSVLGIPSAQVDFTIDQFDFRAQFANSSPANPLRLTQGDQYPNWAGGAGFTPKQGIRIGVSAYRGPYLERSWAFYSAGETRPRNLPATAFGVDAQWAAGPWTVGGEWQTFRFDYHVRPVQQAHAGYAEAKRTINPRWYVATRAGYLTNVGTAPKTEYEFTAAFRPANNQLLKVGFRRARWDVDELYRTVAIEYVTTASLFSRAWQNH